MNEFTIIKDFFAKRARQRDEVILGIGDDCAIVDVPDGYSLAVSTDTLNVGIHFPENTSAYAIGYKSLAVNLSDLAAMGADPGWVMLALTLPSINTEWLNEFCNGFFALVDQYSLQLIGGDTTRGPLSITAQVFGFVNKQYPLLRRDGAKVGDLIYVTGQLGDAGLALRAIQKKISLTVQELNFVTQRLELPQPRVTVGKALLNVASAAIDVSDGLAADLDHILISSRVGATIEVNSLPISSVVKKNLSPNAAIELALTAGDDYELCFTVAANNKNSLETKLNDLHCNYQCIGVVEEKPGLRLNYADGKPFKLLINEGYIHFAE